MIRLEGIKKSYGTRAVLHDVGFDIREGRLTGFVGGNGAGKTTTMRILLGLLAKDAGEITFDGRPATPEERRRCGYMPEERGLYPKMKVLEQIIYLARLKGLSKADATRRSTEILERLGLGERLKDNVETLSLGNQQRAQVAAALVHDPEVLVLDEPFSGLDPLAVDTVAEVLQQHAAAGASVLFSSHQLEVVERLCDDLVILADGRVRASGSRDELRKEHSSNSYRVIADADLGWLREEEGVTVVDLAADHAVFEASDEATAQRVLRRALGDGAVHSFAPLQPSLSQIFKEVIR